MPPPPRPRLEMPGDLNDPHSMGSLILEYLEWLKIQNYSDVTINTERRCLVRFAVWCEERGVANPRDVTTPILNRYKRHLFHYRMHNGRPLKFRTQQGYLVYIRTFFRWLAKNNYILFDPGAALELPRTEKSLPKVMTELEMEKVLAQVDAGDVSGIRDRAILEAFYSTGMRRSELINLGLSDLDVGGGTMFIRKGKGAKDRMVPIGERAVTWVVKYLDESRPKLVMEPDDGFLFLNGEGRRFSDTGMSVLVRGYIKSANLGKMGSCHLIRHTMATVMLEHGADIRYIQHMLGHEHLTSTQIYTHVSIRKLKEVHAKAHPAKMPAKSTAPKTDTPAIPSDGPHEEHADIETLFTSLAADMKDDWTN